MNGTPTDNVIFDLLNLAISKGISKQELYLYFYRKDVSIQARKSLKAKFCKLMNCDMIELDYTQKIINETIKKNKRTEWRKEYEQKNKLKLNNYKNEYFKNKRKNDELFKLKHTIRNTILNSFKKNRISKNLKAEDLLGCTFEEFKEYIEAKFIDGMNWDNRGLYGWHLDHIYPISLAKDEAHLIELNHYTNFQPLWAIDNLSKGNKIL